MAKKQPATDQVQDQTAEAVETEATTESVVTIETTDDATDQVQDQTKPEGPQLYVVAWDIKHAGKRYAPGAELELSDEAAAPFVASGAIALKG